MTANAIQTPITTKEDTQDITWEVKKELQYQSQHNGNIRECNELTSGHSNDNERTDEGESGEKKRERLREYHCGGETWKVPALKSQQTGSSKR